MLGQRENLWNSRFENVMCRVILTAVPKTRTEPVRCRRVKMDVCCLSFLSSIFYMSDLFFVPAFPAHELRPFKVTAQHPLPPLQPHQLCPKTPPRMGPPRHGFPAPTVYGKC